MSKQNRHFLAFIAKTFKEQALPSNNNTHEAAIALLPSTTRHLLVFVAKNFRSRHFLAFVAKNFEDTDTFPHLNGSPTGLMQSITWRLLRTLSIRYANIESGVSWIPSFLASAIRA